MKYILQGILIGIIVITLGYGIETLKFWILTMSMNAMLGLNNVGTSKTACKTHDLRSVSISGHQSYHEGYFHMFTDDGQIITESEDGAVHIESTEGKNIKFDRHLGDHQPQP